MAPVAIVSDTCHYLPRELVAAHGIHEVSLYVHWDGDDQARERDRRLRRLLRAAAHRRGPADHLAAFDRRLPRRLRAAARGGRDIVSIHLAGGMSGTVRSAEQAREQLGSRAERVHVIDSATACGGEGLVILAAAAAAAETGADGGGRRRTGPPGARGPEDVVCDRHARVPAARRPDRRRPGVARLGAEDQADPHGRVRDHARSSACARRGRAFERMVDLLRLARRGRRRRMDGPAHPGARARPRSWPGAGPRSSAASRW